MQQKIGKASLLILALLALGVWAELISLLLAGMAGFSLLIASVAIMVAERKFNRK